MDRLRNVAFVVFAASALADPTVTASLSGSVAVVSGDCWGAGEGGHEYAGCYYNVPCGPGQPSPSDDIGYVLEQFECYCQPPAGYQVWYEDPPESPYPSNPGANCVGNSCTCYVECEIRPIIPS